LTAPEAPKPSARAARVAAFSRIWRENLWADAESRSGPGSRVARTEPFRAALGAFLFEARARVLYDAPCGDFNWMRLVRLPPGTQYIGADIVPELVAWLRERYEAPGRTFRVADVVEDEPPHADVWLCRESLFHLPLADALRVVDNWRRSTISFFLATTTTSVAHNADVEVGYWRPLNLAAPPFDLGPPAAVLEDGAPVDAGKVVAVWRHPTLRRRAGT
jgi:hypothetical protein